MKVTFDMAYLIEQGCLNAVSYERRIDERSILGFLNDVSRGLSV